MTPTKAWMHPIGKIIARSIGAGAGAGAGL
jgi:hypothetical protein